MVFCDVSWAIYITTIAIISVLHLITITKLTKWFTRHCLWSGHETMACIACFMMSLSDTETMSLWRYKCKYHPRNQSYINPLSITNVMKVLKSCTKLRHTNFINLRWKRMQVPDREFCGYTFKTPIHVTMPGAALAHVNIFPVSMGLVSFLNL